MHARVDKGAQGADERGEPARPEDADRSVLITSTDVAVSEAPSGGRSGGDRGGSIRAERPAPAAARLGRRQAEPRQAPRRVRRQPRQQDVRELGQLEAVLYRVALQALAGVEEEPAPVEEEQGAGDRVARVGAEADDLIGIFSFSFSELVFLFRVNLINQNACMGRC